MSLERLDGKDARVLLIWILAGLIGAGVAYKYFFQAFPEASVQFKVPRASALEQARQFADAQGAHLGGYDSTIVFDLDDTAKTYLEREVGLAQANQMMAGNVHIWYWQTRFFRPLQKEEFDVRVDPGGDVVGYMHELEEAAPGARLERAQAQAIAESFLRDTMRTDLSLYEFREEEANFTERPNRRDWSFSWERRGFRAKDATYRLNVTLGGDRVNGYSEFLKVPEAWKLDYERLRTSNNLFEYVALIPYAFLLGGCLYVIVSLGRQGLLEWRIGLALGIFLTVLYFVMTMNQWPLDRASYDTNTPYSSFFLSQVGQAILISIVSAVLVVLAVVPGEPLYRVSQPDKIRLDVGFRLPGIRTKEFFRANVIGICLAAAHIGYITIFYIITRKLGAWAPQDLNYENVVSTTLPWVYPLAIGIYAATSEEFLFRLFAIPYLMRITKSRFLAVVLPAFMWGFLHSNYPQEPAYIRGIEVGLIGIVAGLVMLRWGILATLIWHYTVDAFLISTSLLRSSGAYLRISGAIVGGAALIPLAIAAISYISRQGFTADPQLLNSARLLGGRQGEEAVTAGPAEAIPGGIAPGIAPSYTAMSSSALLALIVCGVLGAALLLGIKREAIGDFVRFQSDAKEATERAGRVLRENQLDPVTYHHAATVTYTFDGYTNEYLQRTIGIAAANRVYRDQVPSAFWTIRYFRDSQNEEYMVVLRPDGSLHSIHHTLDEKTPGANLTKEEALSRAEAYLRDQKKADLSAWNLVETNTQKRPARTDHVFEWEQKAALDTASGMQGAHIRMQVQVQGDEVSGYRIFIKIPEAWRDVENRPHPAIKLVQSYGTVLLYVILFVSSIVIFIRDLKNPDLMKVPWRRIAVWSASAPFAYGLGLSNTASKILSSYTTTEPVWRYLVTEGIQDLMKASLLYAIVVLAFGLGWLFLYRSLGRHRGHWDDGMPSSYYRDAFYVCALGTPAIAGLYRLPELMAHWPLVRHYLLSNVPGDLDSLLPSVQAITDAVTRGMLRTGVLALAAGFIAMYIRRPWMRFCLVLALAMLLATNLATPSSFLLGTAIEFATLGIIWWGATRVIGLNFLGYILMAVLVEMLAGAIELIEQPNPYLRANGYAVLAFMLAMLAWPLMHWRRNS